MLTSAENYFKITQAKIMQNIVKYVIMNRL